MKNVRMTQWTFVTLLSLFSLSFPGCGTWSGNPPGKSNPPDSTPLASVALTVKAVEPLAALRSVPTAPTRSTGSALTILGASGQAIGVLELKKALVAVQDIRFRVNDGDAELRERFRGPYAINLLTGESTPALGTIQLAQTTYREASLEIRKLDRKDLIQIRADSELLDRSLYIEAVFKPISGSEIALTLTTDSNETLSIPSLEDGASLGAGANSVLIAFRLAKWFDFTGKVYDFNNLGSSVVVLNDRSEGVEKELRDVILRNIKDSADFGAIRK